MTAVCPSPLANQSLLQPISSTVHYILSGTFNTLFLYLLAFNPSTAELTVERSYRAEGPHQFLALNEQRTKAYATTWGAPARLSAWDVLDGGRGGIEKINTVPITATSSYIQYSTLGDLPRIYSAGGPTGEVHDVDPLTGGFGNKLQELLYVEKHELEKADKTRVALRYGSHGIDLNPPRRQAFVPHLGHNSIFMYNVLDDGTLDLIADCPSFGDGHDGPRHVVPSPDGSVLYAVTEHTSFVDVYSIQDSSLSHLQRLSVIPPSASSTRLSYRGDTLRLSQSGSYLYATTRGMTKATKGFVAVWSVNADGTLGSAELLEEGELARDGSKTQDHAPLDRFETKTSGGKANAVETFPFHTSAKGVKEQRDWVLLTDDEDGWVWVLEWDGRKIKEIAGVRLGEGASEEEKGTGASHAVWLS
ncbi:Lactonase, 7-bladed beta-propeller-domain-containing protein [Leucosporidium creatinivorum]|uniref:Lactonase, 7-bladed beta-propeller-domain-containing protein n=1 Tax=Leucosporidium creatinivorum TaxID=106004 RepID=A0A1Y2G0F5_9BASI|nr:Lactonase, 7-bladed beta-propeller-domain-containing protein [Leucosporidium creatinivorum]